MRLRSPEAVTSRTLDRTLDGCPSAAGVVRRPEIRLQRPRVGGPEESNSDSGN